MLLGRRSGPKGCVSHPADRPAGSRGVGEVTLSARRGRIGVRARLAEAVGDDGANLAQMLYLLGSQRVEEVRAHALDVTGRGRFEGGKARVSQDSDLATTIGRAHLSAHPAVFFQPSHGVRQPAARRHRSVGEFAHAQASVGYFRQSNQHLVVRVRHAGVTGEFLIEPLGQHVGGRDEGAPDALFGSRQPSSRRGR